MAKKSLKDTDVESIFAPTFGNGWKGVCDGMCGFGRSVCSYYETVWTLGYETPPRDEMKIGDVNSRPFGYLSCPNALYLIQGA